MKLKEYRCSNSFHAERMTYGMWRNYMDWPVLGDSDPNADGYMVIINKGTDRERNTWYSLEDFKYSFEEI